MKKMPFSFFVMNDKLTINNGKDPLRGACRSAGPSRRLRGALKQRPLRLRRRRRRPGPRGGPRGKSAPRSGRDAAAGGPELALDGIGGLQKNPMENWMEHLVRK